jgi:nuclear transcription factor Y gamma
MNKVDPEVFKNHQLPLARVKKIMKSDEDVRVNRVDYNLFF